MGPKMLDTQAPECWVHGSRKYWVHRPQMWDKQAPKCSVHRAQMLGTPAPKLGTQAQQL